jgi:hypothetical protein
MGPAAAASWTMTDLASAQSRPDASYDRLVSEATANPAQADYTSLRSAYARSPQYDPDNLATRPDFDAAWQAFRTGDCTTALAKTGAVLKVNFTYVAMHAVRSACFDKLGQAIDAARERAIARGLTDSIMASGDGKGFKTAFVVVTLDEEQLILAHEGITERHQALLSQSGHTYDEIDGTLKGTGARAGILFQIDAITAGEMRALGQH